MEKIYDVLERRFEKISELSTRILGNSIVFILVLLLVCGWFIMVLFSREPVIGKIRDCFIAISFLTFFLVQRTLNKYNRAMHVKLNELVKTNNEASNELINIENKSHKEIDEVAKDLHDKNQPL